MRTLSFKNFFKKTQAALIEFNDIQKVSIRVYKFAYNADKVTFTLFFITSFFTYLYPFLRNYIEATIIDSLITAIYINENTKALLYLLITYIFVLMPNNILNSLNRYAEYMLGMALDKAIDLRLAKKYSELDLEYYENSKYNDLIQRTKENDYKVRAFVYNSISVFNNIISLLTSGIILISFSPFIFILLFITNIPSFVSELIFGKTTWTIWMAKGVIRRSYTESYSHLLKENSLNELKIFRTRKYLYNIVNNLYTNFMDEQKRVERSRIFYTTLLGLTGILGFGYAYYFVLAEAVSGNITLGLFTFYVATISRISSSIGGLFSSISRYYEHGLGVIDFFKLLDLPKIIKGGKVKFTEQTTPNIEFKNVWFKYPNSKKYVLRNFNLKIKAGEHIAIVGENGAGKTTLVKLLQRFYDVTKGEILINDINIKELNLDNWYKQVATLSQNYVKYHFDAATNIGLGNKERMEESNSIIESAKLSGAHSFIKNYKQKYKQVLSKRFPKGIEPSEGQWQKIALARAFFKNPPVLILDEPTSAIDPKAEFEIFQKLFDFAKNKTVLIISHRFSTVRNADKIIVIDNGEIVESGTHKQLIEKGGLYKEAYDLQKKGYEDV